MSANDKTKNVSAALPAGHRFNEFEIKEVIGGGGFGIVYRAWDHLLERTIAIKEYFPVSLATRHDHQNIVIRGERCQKLFNAGLNSFIHEARLLARFNHPGLLHVLRFWEENGTAYMGTLYYSGMTLKEWQHNSPETLTDAWIRQLLPPLFGAINTIHQAGYLHRDISLDNIQIQDNQLPVLLDFGSARKEIGNLSDETEIMLKPGYAPIEQYSEDSNNDQGPWTDIYALGAVMHTLVMGSPPPVSVVRCIEDRYQPLTLLRPPGFSLPLLNAIDRSLAMKPQDRPQSIDELASLIELSVGTVEELVATATPLLGPGAEPPSFAEPEGVTPTGTDAKMETVTTRPVHHISKKMAVTGVTALLGVIIALATVLMNRNDAPAKGQEVGEISQENGSSQPSFSGADTRTLMARVYLKMSNTERLTVDGKPVDVKPDINGFASLNLSAGSYKIELQSANAVRWQQLEVSHVGTWLIDPQQVISRPASP
ncbi:serine/threonine protein kinase [Erwinia psidii]|uniref:Serine/threonine protein kinase n=1 Tax=Erwinia psidii TaxID=69224 RepID=A0A3N6TTJ1_9GAMM|nr:serine/threonine-protein kinase [Erwinia psidii]MCX8955874.1 serine/threonine protein kinase [Erwinia psidii]MCX8961245.1 serine/threonine protein kinase [Erwinia psidii]MCX8966422.1 serine/threonine protein kinase [Erwinia psidii]RQM38592.1 serine/threonine protein kinase [Erwinia psidii]